MDQLHQFFSEFLTLAFPSVTDKSFDAEQLILRLWNCIISFLKVKDTIFK